MLITPEVDHCRVPANRSRRLAIVGQVEWSADLKSWSRDRVEQSVSSEDETHLTVRASVPVGTARRAFFRLAVQRVP